LFTGKTTTTTTTTTKTTTKNPTISVFKLNFMSIPLVCVAGHCPILDNLNLVQHVLKY